MVDEKLGDDQVWVTVVATGFGDIRRTAARASAGVEAPGRSVRAPEVRGVGARSVRSARVRARARATVTTRDEPESGAAARADRRTARHGAPRALILPRARRPRIHSPRLGRRLGVVAAGHELSARAGADALRAGGNAVDAALGAMLAVVHLRAAAHRSRRRRLHARVTPGRPPVVLDFFVEAPGRGADDRTRGPSWSRSTSRSATRSRSSTSAGHRWAV